jgi:hypothetical protein
MALGREKRRDSLLDLNGYGNAGESDTGRRGWSNGTRQMRRHSSERRRFAAAAADWIHGNDVSSSHLV